MLEQLATIPVNLLSETRRIKHTTMILKKGNGKGKGGEEHESKKEWQRGNGKVLPRLIGSDIETFTEYRETRSNTTQGSTK